MIWGLIIIGFQLPFYIYSVIVETPNDLVNSITFFIQLAVFYYFIRKEISSNLSLPNVEFAKLGAATGAALGLLDGFLAYLYYNQLRSDILTKQIEVTQQTYDKLGYAPEITTQAIDGLQKVLQSPLYHVFLASFMWICVFSITAALFGWIIKKQQN